MAWTYTTLKQALQDYLELGLSTAVTPSEQVSLILNLMNGRESDLQTGVESTRFLAEAVVTIKPVKNLTLALNGDYAVQKDSAPDGSDAKLVRYCRVH